MKEEALGFEDDALPDHEGGGLVEGLVGEVGEGAGGDVHLAGVFSYGEAFGIVDIEEVDECNELEALFIDGEGLLALFFFKFVFLALNLDEEGFEVSFE